MKTANDFGLWFNDLFHFCYGSGEEHIIPALRRFIELTPAEGTYDYNILEAELTGAVAWLMIDAAIRAGIVEYGTSPRFGFLTDAGRDLRKFMLAHSADEMLNMAYDSFDDSY